MNALPERRSMTLAEFLDWEERQEERYEFIDGVIYPKDEGAFDPVGGTVGHYRIAANLDRALSNRLHGSPCEAFRETVKVATDAGVFYPDVFVTCQKLTDRDRVVNEPIVIFEVLSPSTEDRDRFAKSFAYRSIPSLAQYVVIAQDLLAAESIVRSEQGWLQSVVLRADGVLRIPVLSLDLSLAEIYANTDVLTAAQAEDA